MKIIEFQTIGADPEFGIKKDGISLPSYMFIDNEKGNPKKIAKGFGVVKDNLLIEGNIPPAKTKSDFKANMHMLISLISTILSKSNASLYFEDIITYAKEFIDTVDGQSFGCSSYVDAWELKIKQSPSLHGNKRPIGGHIHIGYKILDKNYNNKDINPALARAFDYFLSLPADTVKYCKERRENYGALGSFRDTKYGFEYRSLGGFFMNLQYLDWVYEQSMKAIEYVSDPENLKKIMSITEPLYDHYDTLGISLIDQVPPVDKSIIEKNIKQIAR